MVYIWGAARVSGISGLQCRGLGRPVARRFDVLSAL